MEICLESRTNISAPSQFVINQNISDKFIFRCLLVYLGVIQSAPNM